MANGLHPTTQELCDAIGDGAEFSRISSLSTQQCFRCQLVAPSTTFVVSSNSVSLVLQASYNSYVENFLFRQFPQSPDARFVPPLVLRYDVRTMLTIIQIFSKQETLHFGNSDTSQVIQDFPTASRGVSLRLTLFPLLHSTLAVLH
jgi:hypothetical protein